MCWTSFNRSLSRYKLYRLYLWSDLSLYEIHDRTTMDVCLCRFQGIDLILTGDFNFLDTSRYDDNTNNLIYSYTPNSPIHRYSSIIVEHFGSLNLHLLFFQKCNCFFSFQISFTIWYTPSTEKIFNFYVYNASRLHEHNSIRNCFKRGLYGLSNKSMYNKLENYSWYWVE